MVLLIGIKQLISFCCYIYVAKQRDILELYSRKRINWYHLQFIYLITLFNLQLNFNRSTLVLKDSLKTNCMEAHWGHQYNFVN